MNFQINQMNPELDAMQLSKSAQIPKSNFFLIIIFTKVEKHVF